MTQDGALEIARRARGTPRIAGRLLRRVADFALVDDGGAVTAESADSALRRLEVDAQGLDAMDHKYLKCIETLAAALSEPRDAIEDIIEPYLMQKGLVKRTPRGRMLSAHAFEHIGLKAPKNFDASQLELLAEETKK